MSPASSASSVSRGVCCICQEEVQHPTIQIVERVQRAYHQACFENAARADEMQKLREGKDLLWIFKYTSCVFGGIAVCLGSFWGPLAGAAAFFGFRRFEASAEAELKVLEAKGERSVLEELV